MWLWIVIGVGTYLALLLVIGALAASARMADRRERRIFARWLAERRTHILPPAALRDEQPKAA